MANTSRLFIAVDPSDDFKRRLDDQLSRFHGSYTHGVKWDRPEKFHLTLAFLGETPDRLLPGVLDACRQAAASAHPFGLRFDQPGTFPSRGFPSVLWLGCAEQPAFRQLANSVRAGLRQRKIQFDGKPFLPHLTLARVKRECPNAAELADEFRATRFSGLDEQVIKLVTIYRSELRQDGAVYTALESLALLVEE